MTAYNGILCPSAGELDGVLSVPINRGLIVESAQPPVDFLTTLFGVRSLVDTSAADVGVRIIPFEDSHIYERVWLEPVLVEAGFIVEDVMYSAWLWNAYRDQSVTLSDIVEYAVSGTYMDQGTFPRDLEIWEEEQFDLYIYKTGPPILNGTYTFELDVVSCVLGVTGMRVIPFFYDIDWDGKFNLTYNFSTVIAESKKLYEQRRQLYANPRRTFDIKLAVWEHFARSVRNHIRYGQDKVFGIPVYSECMTINETGDIHNYLVLNINEDLSEYWNLSKADFVMLFDIITWEGEIKELVSCTDTSITFNSVVAGNFEAYRTIAYPVVICLLDKKKIKGPTDRISTATLTFKEFIRGA